MGAGHLKSGRSQMRGNSLSYKMFKGVNCRGFFFFMRLVLRSFPISVLTFLRRGQLVSRRLIFLSRLVCDHDYLGCCSDIVLKC